MHVVGSTLPMVPAGPTLTAPAFGAWLADLRGARSLEQVARKLRPLVDLEVPPSLLHKIERGRVPSWPMLVALSAVYEQPAASMTLRLLRTLTTARGVPLTNVSASVSQADEPGPTLSLAPERLGTSTGGDSAERARIRELEERVDELDAYRLIVERLRPVLGEALALVGAQDDHAAHAPTRRRTRAGKARG